MEPLSIAIFCFTAGICIAIFAPPCENAQREL